MSAALGCFLAGVLAGVALAIFLFCLARAADDWRVRRAVARRDRNRSYRFPAGGAR